MSEKQWELVETDPISGRQIFKLNDRSYSDGGHDFGVSESFEVRDASGALLMRAHGSAMGSHYCHVMLFFVEGTNGTQVRLDESDNMKDGIFDVPDKFIEGTLSACMSRM